MAQETTISDYVDNYRDLELSYETIHFKEKDSVDATGKSDNKMILLGDSLLDKYRKDLEEITISKRLTSKERIRYHCNPWVLSFDLYGTVEYWGLLVDINNMSSVTEFTRSNIKVFDSTLPDLIESILALEEDSIDLNTESVEGDDLEVLEDYEESDSYDDIDEGDDIPDDDDLSDDDE